MPTENTAIAAEQLFYAAGIRAVGVERLLTTSGVGRASFYRHFASEDDLVVAMLRGYDQRFRAWLAEAMSSAAADPPALFDALGSRFTADDFRGCASINIMAEVGFADHATLTEQFLLLLDGAIVSALRERTSAPAHRAEVVARALLSRASRRS